MAIRDLTPEEVATAQRSTQLVFCELCQTCHAPYPDACERSGQTIFPHPDQRHPAFKDAAVVRPDRWEPGDLIDNYGRKVGHKVGDYTCYGSECGQPGLHGHGSTGTNLPKVHQHAFNKAADATRKDAGEICDQRGEEYMDSWALENVYAPRIRAVMKLIGVERELTREELRLIMAAGLVDVKTSRWGGEFKYDTPVDEINYLAALAQWMKEYVHKNGLPGAKKDAA